jgi:CheY-like chemotaxis protein
VLDEERVQKAWEAPWLCPPVRENPKAEQRRVLAVDPHPLVRQAYETLLGRLGFDVRVVDGLFEAFELLPGYDVLLANAAIFAESEPTLLSAVRVAFPHAAMVLTLGGPSPGMDRRAAELASMVVVGAIHTTTDIAMVRVDGLATQGFVF